MECDHLWKELQAEAKVSEVDRTTLAEQELELDMMRSELWGLSPVRRRHAMPCSLCHP